MDIFDVLEFNKIKERLLLSNINALSSKKISLIKPYYDDEIIQEEIDKTKEGYLLVSLGTFPNLAYLNDISLSLDKVHKNAILSLEEIYEVSNTLSCIISIKEFVSNHKIDNEKFRYTLNYINKLQSLPDLLEQIKFTITPSFTIYDHASSKLKTIRSNIKKCEVEIKEKLNNFLRNNAQYLTDNYIANRKNHYVLPVNASYKNKVSGLLIDVSSTQNTYFIEPYFVSEYTILLEQLHYEEEIEIQRIIKALCDLINRNYDELLINNEILSEISFILLKGNFGLSNSYEVATLNDNNEFNIKGAYHPLIDSKKVIKNDFALGGNNNNIIVISGPNAGGKTVALKTVALIALMNQCGLPLPVKEASLPVFRHIFVEIGDEQSIEQSLSGFSSHMKNVIEIVNHIDDHSLVIIDELGGKTDPIEGEALAKAIIDYFCQKNVLAMITTHYLGIKDYAALTSSITLASMGFNEDTLLPTYRLLLDVIGRSYALEISSRLGLNENIIDKARHYKSASHNTLDSIIDELSKKLNSINLELEKINKQKHELEEKSALLTEEKNKFLEQQKAFLNKSNQEKDEMLFEAQEQIQQIVNEFKDSLQKDGLKPHLKNNALNKLALLSTNNDENNNDCNENIKVNDEVIITSLSKIGIVKDIKNDKCIVDYGNGTIKVSLNDLKKNTNKKVINKKVVKLQAHEAVSRNVPLSLMLVGMHVDEALIALRNYIDAAMLVRYQQVRIVHGYGTGALRKAVHEYLKSCKYVESFHLGGFNEGGSGATVVILRMKK
ncbi:MAG: Smr/MutS family protein [Erysipelotrichaceae bacterium]|nr:Smr/MutS family protein [Erysipelotrichaceae bacterium]